MSLSPTIIKYPNAEDKKQTADHFHQTKKFPNVIGKQLILKLYMWLFNFSHLKKNKN